MKTNVQRVCILLIVLIYAMMSLTFATTSIRTQLRGASCGITTMIPSGQSQIQALQPFPAVTADWRIDAHGTYYVPYSYPPSFLNAADIGWDGIQSTADDGSYTLRLANALSPSESVSAVAHENRILYDFTYLSNIPLILYSLGTDNLPKTADDLIIPLVIDHIPGSDTKDIAKESIVYLTLQNGFTYPHYWNFGSDGLPHTTDDYRTQLLHLVGSSPVVEIKTSYAGKIATLRSNGRAEIYDIGPDMMYNTNDDSSFIIPLSQYVDAIDISPDGRYTVYAWGNTAQGPSLYLDIYDAGPNSRIENLQGDDWITTFAANGTISEPRIDGVDKNIRAIGRLAYFVTANRMQTLYYLNVGQDGRFGQFNNVNDDFGGSISTYNRLQKRSLRIAQSLITFEDNIDIYFYSICA